jgi:hypothetical protein
MASFQGSQVQIPLVGVVVLEIKMGIRVFISLFQYRILEGIALAKSSIAMVIVVHPLIDRRCLFADRLERRVRMQQSQPRRQPVVRHPVDAYLAVVVRNILDQPVDRVISVICLVGLLGIVRIVPLGHQEYAF